MADRYLLESGAPDGYLLEDGSGVLLLDAPQWSLVATSKNDAKYANAPQTSPLTIPVPAGAQVGDVIDVLFQYGTPSTTDIAGLAATDDATTPNTYLQTGSTNYSSAHGQGMAAFRAVVADASAANISISWTANANAFIAGIAHLRRCAAGHVTADPLTGTPNQANQATPGTGTDAINSGTTTPLVSGSLIVCYLMYPGSSPSSTTKGTSFTLAIDDTTTAQQASEWLEQVSAAAIAGTWTEGSAQPAMTIVFALAPPAGAVVSAGAAVASFSAVAVTHSQGPVMKNASPAIANWQGVALTLTRGPVSRSAVPAVANWSGVPVALTRGPVTKTASPAVATWQGVSVTLAKGPISRTVVPATAQWLGIGVSLTRGPITKTAGIALASWRGIAVTPGSGVVKAAVPAVAAWSGVALSLTRGPVSRAVSPAVATWLTMPVTVARGTVTQAVNPAVAHWQAVAVFIVAATAGSAPATLGPIVSPTSTAPLSGIASVGALIQLGDRANLSNPGTLRSLVGEGASQ